MANVALCDVQSCLASVTPSSYRVVYQLLVEHHQWTHTHAPLRLTGHQFVFSFELLVDDVHAC